MKKCSKCKLNKSILEFGKQQCRPDGLYPFCAECLKTENLKYKRSFSGFINTMYGNMKRRVLDRQCIYWYGLPILSKEKFCFWINRNNKFKRLYKNWVTNNYDKRLTPSIDRIDSSKGYLLGNIQVIGTQDNRFKALIKRWGL